MFPLPTAAATPSLALKWPPWKAIVDVDPERSLSRHNCIVSDDPSDDRKRRPIQNHPISIRAGLSDKANWFLRGQNRIRVYDWPNWIWDGKVHDVTTVKVGKASFVFICQGIIIVFILIVCNKLNCIVLYWWTLLTLAGTIWRTIVTQRPKTRRLSGITYRGLTSLKHELSLFPYWAYFFSNACLYLLESVVSLLLGSPLIFQIVLPVFSCVLLAHLGVLLRLVCRRVRFWVLFYTSSLPLKLVLSLPPALFWAILMQTMFRPINTVWHLMLGLLLIGLQSHWPSQWMDVRKSPPFESFENSIYLAWHSPAVS